MAECLELFEIYAGAVCVREMIMVVSNLVAMYIGVWMSTQLGTLFLDDLATHSFVSLMFAHLTCCSSSSF